MPSAPPNLAQPRALAGTRLGRYEILTQIASGGMATVYLGRVLGAAGFERLVAVKFLHQHVANDEVFVSMFLDEARLAAKIRHPNVVPTLDLENGPDGLFLVMEYVEGDSLVGLIRSLARAKRPLPPGITVRVILDALAGLRAAHELTDDSGELLNLVHRDVSPHNILIGVDGIAKITDFGVARANARVSVTREGQIKGKLAYMAPEQTTSDPVDARADLFAIGIVLWECLAGRRLFQAETDGAVLRKLLDHPIPKLREIAPEYPEAIERVCMRALERDPAHRFASAAEFSEALEAAGVGLAIATSREVGALVREMSGPTLTTLRAAARPSQPAIAMAGSEVEAATSVRDVANAPVSSSDAGMIVPLVKSISAPPPAAHTVHSSASLPAAMTLREPPPRRLGWIALLATAALLVFSVIAVFAFRGSHDEPAAGNASPSVGAAPTSPATPSASAPAASPSAAVAADSAKSGDDVTPVEKLPVARPGTRPPPRLPTRPHASPPPRPKASGTGAGDNFDPESL